MRVWERGILTQFDYALFMGALILALLGALGIYNASPESGDYSFFLRHLLWIALGVSVCLFVMSIDYHFLADHAFLLYALSALLLIGTLFFGTEINGSRSWLTFGGMSFQPSELAKLTVILLLAQYLGELDENHLERRHCLILASITLFPMILITIQGDLGMALMYLPILMGMVVVAGVKPALLVHLSDRLDRISLSLGDRREQRRLPPR